MFTFFSKPKKNFNYFESLPFELQFYVLSFLNKYELSLMRQCSKKYLDICGKNTALYQKANWPLLDYTKKMSRNVSADVMRLISSPGLTQLNDNIFLGIYCGLLYIFNSTHPLSRKPYVTFKDPITFPFHRGDISSLLVLKDNKILLGTKSGYLIIFDVNDFLSAYAQKGYSSFQYSRKIKLWQGHHQAIKHLLWFNKETFISSTDNAVCFWDFNGECQRSVKLDDNFKFLASGKNNFITANDHAFMIYNNEGVLLKRVPANISEIRIWKNLIIYACKFDVYIHIWDIETQKELYTLEHGHGVYAMEVLPNGYLISSAMHNHFYIWHEWRCLHTFKLEDEQDCGKDRLKVLSDGSIMADNKSTDEWAPTIKVFPILTFFPKTEKPSSIEQNCLSNYCSVM